MSERNKRGEILAAGAVLWRAAGDGVQIAVAHRPHYDDWSLPKGKLDHGETLAETAVREVLEETGFHSVLGARLGRANYHVGARAKSVEYYSARVTGGEFAPNDEVDELRWCTPEQARDLFSYPFDATIVDRFLELPRDGATILLVRHAKAGDRDHWRGHDDDRPLSEAGHRQALALQRWLGLFAATRVHAAPRVRCVDTVSPLAHSLGVDVIDEPKLSEEGYWSDPAAGLARLRELASGVVAICSQGGVIPDIVRELNETSTSDALAPNERIPSKKGSVWVLTFDARAKLAAADYYWTALPLP